MTEQEQSSGSHLTALNDAKPKVERAIAVDPIDYMNMLVVLNGCP